MLWANQVFSPEDLAAATDTVIFEQCLPPFEGAPLPEPIPREQHELPSGWYSEEVLAMALLGTFRFAFSPLSIHEQIGVLGDADVVGALVNVPGQHWSALRCLAGRVWLLDSLDREPRCLGDVSGHLVAEFAAAHPRIFPVRRLGGPPDLPEGLPEPEPSVPPQGTVSPHTPRAQGAAAKGFGGMPPHLDAGEQESAGCATVPLRKRLLPNAMAIPGMLHILDNATKDLHSHMRNWESFRHAMSSLAGLVCERPRRELLVANAWQHTGTAFLKAKITRPYDKRWGTTSQFLRDCRPWLPLLRDAWQVAGPKILGNPKKTAASELLPELDAGGIAQALCNPLFEAYLNMVLAVEHVIDDLRAWCESCPCHYLPSGPGITQRRREDLGSKSNCAMAGKRAPEMVMGRLLECFRELARISLGDVVSKARLVLTPADLQLLTMDASHCQGHLEAVLATKLAFWEQLPWLLCGLASHDPEHVQKTARRALELFQATPPGQQEWHHPQSVRFLHESGEKDVRALAEGDSREARSATFRQAVAAFAFIPIAERVIEGRHKDVKFALGLTKRAGPAEVSVALRHDALMQSLSGTPGFRSAFLLHLRTVRQRSGHAMVRALQLLDHPKLARCVPAQDRGHGHCHRGATPGVPCVKPLLREIVYRCDFDAQYLNVKADSAMLGHRAAAAKNRMECERFWHHVSAASKPRLSEETVLAAAMADHLHHLSERGGGSLFSTAPTEAGSLPLAPLRALLQGPSGAVAPRQLVAIVDPDDPHVLPSPAALGDDPLNRTFFQVIHCRAHRLKRAPTAPPVRNHLQPWQVTILPHYYVTTLGAAPDEKPVVVQSPRQDEDVCRVHMLCLPEARIQDFAHVLLHWEVSDTLLYGLQGFRGQTASPEVTSELLNERVHSVGRDPSQSGDVDAMRALPAHPQHQTLLAELSESGCAVLLPAGWRMTAEGATRLHFSLVLRRPREVLNTLPDVPLEEHSALEMMLRLRADGWQWRKWPRSPRGLRQESPVYARGGPKVWYTKSHTVSCDYLLALLRAEELFGGGCASIPHDASAADYRNLLAGKPMRPKRRAHHIHIAPDTNVFADPDVAEAGPTAPSPTRRGRPPKSRRIRSSGQSSSSVEDEDDNQDESLQEDSPAESPREAKAEKSGGVHEEDPPAKPTDPPTQEPRRERAAHRSHQSATAAIPERSATLTGFRWGCFLFTPKQPIISGRGSGGRYGGWQAACPFHKKSAATGCKRFVNIRGPRSEDSQAAIVFLKAWCVAAPRFDRQRLHVQYRPPMSATTDLGAALDAGVGSQFQPPGDVRTDDALDAAAVTAAAAAGDGDAEGSSRGSSGSSRSSSSPSSSPSSSSSSTTRDSGET